MCAELERKELIFNLPWGTIAAISWGNPKDEAVIVVHGTLDNADTFTRLISHLPKNYHFVSIDLPGHGKSSHFPPGMNLDYSNFILAVCYVLDELQWDKCIFMGHSFGAGLGVLLSIIYPDRLTKIIAIDMLMPKIITKEEIVKRMRLIDNTTIFHSKKKDSKLYTKKELFYSMRKNKIFALNEVAAEAVFDRGVTKVGNLYKLNYDIRTKTFVMPYFNKDQIMQLTKHMHVPILFIIAENSWFDFINERKFLEIYKKKLFGLLTTVAVAGNHNVHNNNPDFIAPSISNFLNETRSKL